MEIAPRGIHEQILLALVQNHVGETFVLGHTDIWVRREERQERQGVRV